MDIETLKLISEMSSNGILAVIIYAVITSIADWVIIAGAFFGARAVWKKFKEEN